MNDLADSLAYLGEEKEPLLQALEKEVGEKIAILDETKLGVEETLRRFPFLTKDPLVENGFRFPAEKRLGRTLSYFTGVFSIQDPSSALPVHFLDVKPGELVLDCCAAPGGKTIQAALNKPALVLANDLSHPRALELSSNIERMGLANVEVISKNLTAYAPDMAGVFDKIILDAPCSGQAMFRKNALAKEDWSLSKVEACATIQNALLDGASIMLREGGTLLYSTCSFTYEEDIGMIKAFLESHPDFQIVKVTDDPRFFHHPDLPEAVYLLPSRYPGEGQFFCLLRKGGDKPARFPSKRKTDHQYADKLASYGLGNYCTRLAERYVYALPIPGFRFSSGVIKYGLQALSLPRFEPCHNLKGQLPKVELNQSEALAYLRGEQLNRPAPSGYIALCYAGLLLGTAKSVHGQIKNRLPKGLRRRFDLKDLI